ncbi:hypothetical protein H9655_17240 [Cytobacillus sp. Sa5YUA1]|uniref:Uncharacterized protein n=1 Tax=Cytobacillus stercorigallinarum TaxID=2762240 RepID=A0ABR8QTG5_9BACI|nr:hypothetical protein [Cytobacillus stercorigallinarum]MBD7938783.1 hypothetical protein [Cytobacillus stercorigallinarum]
MRKLKEIYRYLLFRMFGRKSRNTGWTLFAPLKIVPEYIIDIENGQVTGLVKYDEKVYLTVVVDVLNEKTLVKGSLRRIHKHTKPFKQHNYIEMIEAEAKYLIEPNE